MEDWAEHDLAWELATWACEHITARDRDELYTTIGAGDSYAAISTLLETIAGAGVLVPPRLVSQLGAWLDAYTHHDDAARLHELLNALN